MYAGWFFIIFKAMICWDWGTDPELKLEGLFILHKFKFDKLLLELLLVLEW